LRFDPIAARYGGLVPSAQYGMLLEQVIEVHGEALTLCAAHFAAVP